MDIFSRGYIQYDFLINLDINNAQVLQHHKIYLNGNKVFQTKVAKNKLQKNTFRPTTPN